MFYLIQKNVFKDPRYETVLETLQKLGFDHEVVEFIPRTDEIRFLTERKDVFVYGSVKLARCAQNYDWTPGSFYGGNHNFEVYAKHYCENLLNYGSTIGTFSDPIDWERGEQKFIKPSKDAKVFTGKAFTQMKWENFVTETLKNNPSPLLNADTPIQISRPQKIFKEARVWIVKGKVVTSSYYLFHGETDYEETVAPDGICFAQKMADNYQVADAFVMDICLTAEGWKIVEVNCINSAGIYKADLTALFMALETTLSFPKNRS